MKLHPKLELLSALVASSQRAFAKTENPIGPAGEIIINDILDNLKEMKHLIPLLESDLKALSSLNP